MYLEDIVESAGLIEEYFCRDIGTQDKVIRRLEIIGEAVKHISSDMRKKHPGIPWRKIAGMRDILSHEYFGLEMSRIWKTAHKDVPEFREQIQKILG